jgi:hypothetical protein
VSAYTVGDLRPEHRDAVYRFLSQEAYWSQGLPRDIFDRSIENSLNFAAVTRREATHPDLAKVRNFMLATRDAHGLYARYGFAPLAEPARWMAIRKPYR